MNYSELTRHITSRAHLTYHPLGSRFTRANGSHFCDSRRTVARRDSRRISVANKNTKAAEVSKKTADHCVFLLFKGQSCGIRHASKTVCAFLEPQNLPRHGCFCRDRSIDNRRHLSDRRSHCVWRPGAPSLRPSGSSRGCATGCETRDLGGQPTSFQAVPLRRRAQIISRLRL
jgi:hypothetical protein